MQGHLEKVMSSQCPTLQMLPLIYISTASRYLQLSIPPALPAKHMYIIVQQLYYKHTQNYFQISLMNLCSYGPCVKDAG